MATFQEADKLVYQKQEITAVSTDTGIELQYFGSQKYADVAVDATTGDITVKHGADSSSEVVDTSVGLPTANGVFDVSDATVNTVGELIDYLDESSNWRGRPVAMRRADLLTNTLITKSQTECKLNPTALLRDTTIAVQTNTYTIGVRVGAKRLDGVSDGAWTNRITAIDGVATVATPGSASGYNDGEGAMTGLRLVVYSINDVLKTQRRVWNSAALTSAVAFAFTEADWGGQPLSSDPGEALLVLIQNSGTSATTITSPTLTVQGYREPGSVGRSERFYESNM